MFKRIKINPWKGLKPPKRDRNFKRQEHFTDKRPREWRRAGRCRYVCPALSTAARRSPCFRCRRRSRWPYGRVSPSRCSWPEARLGCSPVIASWKTVKVNGVQQLSQISVLVLRGLCCKKTAKTCFNTSTSYHDIYFLPAVYNSNSATNFDNFFHSILLPTKPARHPRNGWIFRNQF